MMSADREESELDLRLYPDDSEEESWYEPAGDAVEGADSDCCTLVSSKELCSGRGLFWVAVLGVPKFVRN